MLNIYVSLRENRERVSKLTVVHVLWQSFDCSNFVIPLSHMIGVVGGEGGRVSSKTLLLCDLPFTTPKRTFFVRPVLLIGVVT